MHETKYAISVTNQLVHWLKQKTIEYDTTHVWHSVGSHKDYVSTLLLSFS